MNVTAREQILEGMRSCEQSRGLSVLQHGEAVREAYLNLTSHLRNGTAAPLWWRVPAWASDPLLLDRLPPDEILEEYQVFHDCGKPAARSVDAEGKVHFPDHARRSEEIWRAAGGHDLAARLMGMDMLAHTISPDEAPGFGLKPEAPALLLTAIAEIHANAEMFGGIDSDAFKAKAKRLDKRGRIALVSMRDAQHPIASPALG